MKVTMITRQNSANRNRTIFFTMKAFFYFLVTITVVSINNASCVLRVEAFLLPTSPRTVRSNHVLMKGFQLENDAELQKFVLDPQYSSLSSSMFPTSGLDINNNDHSCTGNK